MPVMDFTDTMLECALHVCRPWNVSFSYGRALQSSALKVWAGKPDNVPAAQQAFLARARANSLATLGRCVGTGGVRELSGANCPVSAHWLRDKLQQRPAVRFDAQARAAALPCDALHTSIANTVSGNAHISSAIAVHCAQTDGGQWCGAVADARLAARSKLQVLTNAASVSQRGERLGLMRLMHQGSTGRQL